VPADPNVGEIDGGGLTDTRGAGKADGSRVMIFQKDPPYQQSIQELV